MRVAIGDRGAASAASRARLGEHRFLVELFFRGQLDQALTLMSWYGRKPVPAGMRWPSRTFSLRPMSVVDRARSDASVSTFVDSWNDAPERNESLDSAALVMPGAACGRWPDVPLGLGAFLARGLGLGVGLLDLRL
jgi:hypothetical protein